MINAISTFFYRISSWKTLLLGLILYVPFPAYILKNLDARINTLAGHAVEPIDLLVGYEPLRIRTMVAAYGPEGRAVYAQGELTADLVYPFVYTFLLCVILTLLFRHRTYTSFRLVNTIPIVIFCSDLMENGCIVYLLTTFPNSSYVITSLCSVLTNLKWMVTMIVLGLVLYGLVKLAIRSGQKKIGRRQTTH